MIYRKIIWLLIPLFISCKKYEKPNIIWITIEDQSQYLLPFNGNNDVSLPNLEAIADESLIFDNMYATYPVCAPARSSIITGMYPNSIGTHNMRAMHYDNYIRTGKIGERNTNEQALNIPRYSSSIAESIKTFPELCSIKPNIIPIVVVFPQPFGPNSPITSPIFIEKESLSKATKLLYFFVRFVTFNIKLTSNLAYYKIF